MWYILRILAVFACLTVARCAHNENKLYKGVPDNFFKDCLVEINKYRKRHSAQPLRWNADLQYHAQSWADHLAKNGNVQNDVEGVNKLGQGETVSYMSLPMKKCLTLPPSGDCFACRTTIAKWYNESEYYNYDTGYSADGFHQVLHFTQLVWKGTKKVGIATAISPSHGLITVARFRVRGNIGFVDDYVENVASPVKVEETGYATIEDPDRESESSVQRGPSCRHQKRESKACVNHYGDEICDYYVQRNIGYCNDHRVFMKLHCAKSCDFCGKGRLPAPPVLETKDEKKHNLRWDTGDWLECHGDLQWREVQCYHLFKGRDYQIHVKYCARALGLKPPEYKDCP